MTPDKEIWEAIAAPVPRDSIQWRVDGKPTARDGKHFARFVAYVDAQFVRERLDNTVPGSWDLTLELLPPNDVMGQGGVVTGREYSFKARLQILGVIREDVGTGDDYKSAASDAFKRVAVRFGVATALYSFEQNWVEVDGDGKYAKPVEDPQKAYERREAKSVGASPVSSKAGSGGNQQDGGAPTRTNEIDDSKRVACPKCGGACWDNRLTKRNPKAPDYKCQNRSCDGAIWPPKDGVKASPVKTSSRTVDDSDVRGSLERIDEDEYDTSLPF